MRKLIALVWFAAAGLLLVILAFFGDRMHAGEATDVLLVALLQAGLGLLFWFFPRLWRSFLRHQADHLMTPEARDELAEWVRARLERVGMDGWRMAQGALLLLGVAVGILAVVLDSRILLLLTFAALLLSRAVDRKVEKTRGALPLKERY